MNINQNPYTAQKGFAIASRKIKEVYSEINDYAVHGRPCILFGPTGAGKEFAANHYINIYKKATNTSVVPFHKLNCAGLSDELAISELFGHVKGSYTGAVFDKPGLFEEMLNGVLFLDEIGDLPEKVQSMLLRAVDPGTHEASRLGSNKNYSTRNVIVICATDRPRNKLREALLNRLGHQVFVPGVEERLDDIAPAVLFFTKAALLKRKDFADVVKMLFGNGNEKKINAPDNSDPLEYLTGRIAIRLTPLIEAKSWQGNFREIRIAVDTAVIRAKTYRDVEKFIRSTVSYYKSHLKTVDIIENYAQEPGNSANTEKEPLAPKEFYYDENIFSKIRAAIPKSSMDEKKIWASFFTQLGTRSFFRNEIDNLLPNIKARTILYRLKALEEKSIIKRNGIKGDEYILNEEPTHEAPKEKSSVEPAFPLPSLDFLPEEREKEIEHVLNLINNTRGVFISGDKQSGKTTFAFLLAKKLIQQGVQVYYYGLGESKLMHFLQRIISKVQSQNNNNIPSLNSNNENDLPILAATLTGYLNNLFVSDNHPVIILDNIDILKSLTEIRTLNIMLQQWQFFSFVLVGKKLGNELKMGEDILLAEYKIETYDSEY